MMTDLILLIVIISAGLASYLLKLLTMSGAISAIFIGVAINMGLGIKGLFLLGVFFVTSSLWSRFKSAHKAAMEEKLAKGSTRDWRQVIANGGTAALFSLLYVVHPENIWIIGFTVSLASANSDTWASEIGSLSRTNPIYVRTFKRVERGTSGAVSTLGTAAAIGGALLISIISLVMFHVSLSTSLVILCFGYLGNVFDTFIGAYYQQAFVCKQCGLEIEKRIHCGQHTTKIKGFPLIDNDMVNFLSGLIAAILAVCFIYLTGQ